MIPIGVEPAPRGFAWSNNLIIGLNLAVFWLQVHLPANQMEIFMQHYALVPKTLWRLEPRLYGFFPLPWLALVTSVFLHGSWLHLLGNMLSLWVFGPTIEARMGHLRYLCFYLLAGILGGLGHAAFLVHSTVPCVGASGAIAGVLGAFLFTSPKARVMTLVPFFVIIRVYAIPAAFYLVIWFASQLLLVKSPSKAGTMIAVMAHIVGFLFGAALSWLFKKPVAGRA